MAFKLKMLIEVTCDDCMFDRDRPDSVQWFYEDVLMSKAEDGGLLLHSNDIGETVGAVRVLEIYGWPSTEAEGQRSPT